MHKRVLCLILLLSLLLSVPAAAADSGAGALLRYTRTPMTEGLTAVSAVYAESDGTMQAGYGLELEQGSEVYPILMACDTMFGGMTMTEAVAYTEAQGYTVVGAVNTAFFTAYTVPIGIVVENGRLRSAADGLNAFAILPDGSYYAVREPRVRFALHKGDWAEPVELQYLNKSIETDAIHIYTSDFSTVSTRVNEEVWAVRLQLTEGTLTLSSTVTMQVTEILDTAQAVPIGEGNVILTARKNGANGDFCTRLAVGDVLTLETLCKDAQLKQASYITGCGDILAEDGALTDESTWSPFVAGRHPRTLVGWRSDGTLVMFVADGRSEGYAEGLTQRMAAEEMLRRACQTVVNMDGGGSSVIGARLPGETGVQVRNRPSAGAERQNAGYLMLVTDAQRDGAVRNWHLRENGAMVLPRQRLTLTPFATDAALYPVWTDTQGVEIHGDGELLTDNVYRAPQRAGLHKLTLNGGGVDGTAYIQVVSSPSRLSVTMADGRPLRDAMVLENGDRLAFRIRASHYGVPMPADGSCVDYTVTAPLGTWDDDGVFTVSALPNTEGVLTLQVGSFTHSIRVKVVPSRTNVEAYRMRNALDDF